MTRHAGAEKLARYHQHDLSPRQDARLRAHLAGCTRCRARSDELAGVTTLLAGVQPPPMPEHLTARIHGALAAEAARRVTLTAGSASGIGTGAAQTAGPGTSGAPQNGRPQDGRPPRHEKPEPGRRLRLPGLSSPVALRSMAAVAAAVVIAGGAYEVSQHIGGSPPSSSTGAATPKAAPAGGGARNSGLAPVPPAAAPDLRYQYAGQQATITPVKTSTEFTQANLKSQVSSELTRPSAGRTASPSTRHSAAAAEPGRLSTTFGNVSVADLDGCVNRIAAGGQVLLVDVAHYGHAPATVIVTRASPGGPEQVWVVAARCSATVSDVLAHTVLASGG